MDAPNQTCRKPFVLLLGKYPPPIGGITVHIKRLHCLLRQNGFQSLVLDFQRDDSRRIDGVYTLSLSAKGLATFWKVTRDAVANQAIVHFHVSELNKFKWLAPLFLLYFRKLHLVCTIHSGSFIQALNSLFGRFYIRCVFRRFDKIIAVNSEIEEFLVGCGIKEEKICVIPAYLPQPIDDSLIPDVMNILDENAIKVCTSGYLTPLYNYEVLIDCINQLNDEKFIFIFNFYNQYDKRYEPEIIGKLKNHKNVIIFRDLTPEVFLTVLNKCDVYVRTALLDGDSVAVREALHFGKHVIATDCVKRHAKCLLFGVHESHKLVEYLSRFSSKDKNFLLEVNESSAADELLSLYHSFDLLQVK